MIYSVIKLVQFAGAIVLLATRATVSTEQAVTVVRNVWRKLEEK